MVGTPEASDAQITERLTALGMAPWLAEHLVQWLPHAAALHLYPTLRFDTSYKVGDTNASLADAAVFVAANQGLWARPKATLEALVRRSNIMRGIERMLCEADASGRPYNAEDPLILSLSLTVPRVPVEPGDGGVPRVNETFQRHIAGHGFKTLPDGMSMEAFVYPEVTASTFRLFIDLTVRHPRMANGGVVETVLGMGHTIRDAVNQALSKLELNVMHVFFAALIDNSSCGDQVFWEEWKHQLGRLRVCHGGELHFFNPASIPSFTPLLAELKEALADEPLANGFHALRIFTSHQAEKTLGEEVLLDDELWPRGMEILQAHAWPHIEVPWGVRFFALMEASADVN